MYLGYNTCLALPPRFLEIDEENLPRDFDSLMNILSEWRRVVNGLSS